MSTTDGEGIRAQRTPTATGCCEFVGTAVPQCLNRALNMASALRQQTQQRRHAEKQGKRSPRPTVAVPVKTLQHEDEQKQMGGAEKLALELGQETAPPSTTMATRTGAGVRVLARVRPISEFELGRGDSCAAVLLHGDAGGDCTAVQVAIQGAVDVDRFKTFSFDRCFGHEASQHEIFECSGVRDLLDSAIGGYSATIFAYGQTGSGKTFTMSGYETWLSENPAASAFEDPSEGLVQRSARYVFGAIGNAAAAEPMPPTFSVRMSFCEIYNENVFDLLNSDGAALSVRHNTRSGFFVQSLFLVDCEGVDDAMAVIAEGHRNRTVGGHVLNKDSSRSHSLLTVHVDCESVDPEDGRTVERFGKVVFVDLAGR